MTVYKLMVVVDREGINIYEKKKRDCEEENIGCIHVSGGGFQSA